MSAKGHKQIYAPQKAMSALPPKADVCGALACVCYGPKADIALPGVALSRTNESDCSNPPFCHVTDLVARHRREIIAKEKLPHNRRRAGLGHLRRHPFEKALTFFGRILNLQQLEPGAG